MPGSSGELSHTPVHFSAVRTPSLSKPLGLATSWDRGFSCVMLVFMCDARAQNQGPSTRDGVVRVVQFRKAVTMVPAVHTGACSLRIHESHARVHSPSHPKHLDSREHNLNVHILYARIPARA